MDRAMFKDASFQEAVFAFNFEPIPSIERNAYEFENNLRSVFEKQVIVTKVPDDAPPPFPRFVLRGKNRILEVSQVNAVLKKSFKEIGNEQAFNLYFEKTKVIFDYIKTVAHIESFGSSAIFRYPLIDFTYSVGDAIFNRFFKVAKPSNFKGISFILNQKIDDILVKNMIDSYETREKRVKFEPKGIPPGERLIIKLTPAEMEIVDKGLLNRIEIITDDIKKNDPGAAERLFDKGLSWPKQYITESAEQFIFGGQ
jgi:hypothetical protein